MAKRQKVYKLIVAGSRGFGDYELMRSSIEAYMKEYKIKKLEIVSGGARGADSMGEEYADYYYHDKKIMPANWNRQPNGDFDKAAGYVRNMEMANYADGCIVFWDGISKGTNHMIKIAKTREIDVMVVKY